MSDTSRRTKTAVNQAVHYRNYRRVRDRALRRLAHQYPDQYRQFLEEERAKDEAEGKSWLDITGRTKRSMGSASAPNGGSEVSLNSSDHNQTEARNLGAEA